LHGNCQLVNDPVQQKVWISATGQGHNMLTPSLDLIRRTLDVEAACTLSRLQVLERLPGNPVGIAYQQFEGGVTALMARQLPVPYFNSVFGLGAGHEAHIEPLLAWYREHGVKPRFEVVPGVATVELCRELARLGCFQSDFHCSLICEPDAAMADNELLAIERVTRAVLDEFLETHAAGWGMPDAARFKANTRGWLGQPGWSLYLGRIKGKPAATGILYVKDKVGYCADAATVPAYRGRGLQTALLHRRIADASAAGVDFICSGADFLSASHRNMQRAGMRLQFVRASWTTV
jgi:GNAT superfamily N-acetyltransferase